MYCQVRFVDAALTNTTATAVSRSVYRYANNPWGVSASALDFEDVHVGGLPKPLSSRTGGKPKPLSS